MRLPLDPFWGVRSEGQSALRLSRHDQVLYLGLHALKHNAEHMIWLVELDGLVAGWDESDWNELLERAAEMGQEKCIYDVAYLIHHTRNGQQAAGWRRLVESNRLSFLEKRILRRRVTRGALPFWAPLVFFSNRSGVLGRCRYVFETLFPRPEILRQIIADADELSALQLYWRRFWQLVLRTLRFGP